MNSPQPPNHADPANSGPPRDFLSHDFHTSAPINARPRPPSLILFSLGLMRARYIILFFLASLALCAPLHAGPKKRVSRDYIGTYLNEGKTTVELNMISADGHEGTEITLEPGRIDRAVIFAGQTKLCTPFGTMETKRLLSTHRTPTPESHPQFFNTRGRSFYLRIVGRHLYLVKRQNLTVAERQRLQGFKRELQRNGSYDSEYPVPE